MRVYNDFFWYPDPDQRFLKWIRIRPNDTVRIHIRIRNTAVKWVYIMNKFES